ncbi:guanylate kinase [Perkinsus chesapeaki]|uniref:guanylate kinase n=1 Tax=Perkinsus chesapeaki TaxID=330153 RepID=A0A7J6L890_PERCH|nr:guanylate kinase [Perkinsus chesapeaki]
MAPGLNTAVRRGFMNITTAATTTANKITSDVLVLCGPSGAGKSTLIKRLLKDFPGRFGFSVSHTTRSIRPGEINGKSYNFIDRPTMEAEIVRGEFIEHAEVHGNLYGTSKTGVREVLAHGEICILDIDVQGVESIKSSKDLGFNPAYVFISPPSLQVLEKRLRDRNTETEEAIQKRLTTARKEMTYRDRPRFWDLVLINDDLDKCYSKLKAFVESHCDWLNMPKPKPGEIYQPHDGWSIRACKAPRQVTPMDQAASAVISQGHGRSGLPGTATDSASAGDHAYWGLRRLQPTITPQGDMLFDRDRQVALSRLWGWMSDRFSEIMRKHTRPGRVEVIDALTQRDDDYYTLGYNNRVKTIVGTAGASSSDRAYVFKQLQKAFCEKEVTPYQVLLHRSDLCSLETAIKRIVSRLLSADSAPASASPTSGSAAAAAAAASTTATPIRRVRSQAKTPNTARRENNVDYSDDSDEESSKYVGKGRGGGVPLPLSVSEAVLGLLPKDFNDLSILREWYKSTVHMQKIAPIVVMVEDADASDISTLGALMKLMVNLVGAEYDGRPGRAAALPLSIILGVSGVSASDGGLMDLISDLRQDLELHEIPLLDSKAVFDSFIDLLEISMPALGFPLIVSKGTIAALRDMFINSTMCNEDILRSICYIVRDYFDTNPWAVLCDPSVVMKAAGDGTTLTAQFASRVAGLSEAAKSMLAAHLKQEGCKGYTRPDGTLDEAKACNHLGTLLGQRSRVASLALFWDALTRTTAKKSIERSVRMEPLLFPDSITSLNNDISRMCIAVEKLAAMTTSTFNTTLERTSTWLEKSFRCLPAECLDGNAGTDLEDIIMALKDIQDTMGSSGRAVPNAGLSKSVTALLNFIRRTFDGAIVPDELSRLCTSVCVWNDHEGLAKTCLNVLDVDVFFNSLWDSDAITAPDGRKIDVEDVTRDSKGKLPVGYTEDLSDLTIVYRLYLQHARTIDLEDLWSRFCSELQKNEDPVPSPEDMQVRFGMCLCTLEFLGAIQSPSRGSLMKGQDPSCFYKGLRVKKLYFPDAHAKIQKGPTVETVEEAPGDENDGDDTDPKSAAKRKRSAAPKKAAAKKSAKRGRAAKIVYI